MKVSNCHAFTFTELVYLFGFLNPSESGCNLDVVLSPKKGQFKNLEKAVDIRKSNPMKPLACTDLDGRQDIFLLL